MSWMWIGLACLVLTIIIIDLGIVHRGGRKLSLGAAIGWTVTWLAVGAGFSGAVYLLWRDGHVESSMTPPEAVVDYITCWVLEISLSLDNLFVMALIFRRWSVAHEHQHKVLFYGILGALFFRTLMIFFGVQLIDRFEWLLPVFGLYLAFSGGKALWEAKDDESHDRPPRLAPSKFIGFTVSEPDHAGHFFARGGNGKLVITSLMAALVSIELADTVFALDSVPAALAVTRETWIIVSANALAIIGLRSMYSVLADILDRYNELHIALALLLLYIGGKMIVSPWFKIPNLISLGILIFLLTAGFVTGFYNDRKRRKTAAAS